MADQLTKINISDLFKLSELYAAKHDADKVFYVSYMTIETFMRWFQQDPNLKHVQFYCLNGDFSDGTFVVTDRYTAYADTLNTSHDNLSRLLQLLDYSKGYSFWSTRHEVYPTIVNALNKIGVEIKLDDEALLYRLPKEKALQLNNNLPPGIHLKPIEKQEDLEKANSVWSYRCRNSFTYFERMAKYNSNIGAFTDDGTLVSWMFRFPTGLVAALQTDEKHFGKGYGLLVVKEVSKQIAQLGHDVYSDVFETNRPSRGLFEKLGFEVVGKVHWIDTDHNWTEADE